MASMPPINDRLMSRRYGQIGGMVRVARDSAGTQTGQTRIVSCDRLQRGMADKNRKALRKRKLDSLTAVDRLPNTSLSVQKSSTLLYGKLHVRVVSQKQKIIRRRELFDDLPNLEPTPNDMPSMNICPVEC